jgi:ElaB/YqjD/DUF883 family membrane-anchored ribosome-binding protein
MRQVRISTAIKTTFIFIMFVATTVACNTQEGMMHEGTDSMYMGNWNWVQILIGIVIGFILGYLVARRRK